MKQYKFDFDENQADWIFAPIRRKEEIISLLMKTIKIMLVGGSVSKVSAKGHIILTVAKMSRLFYFSENKYFSINFPFTVKKNTDGFLFSSKYVPVIDSKITSDVISVLNTSEALKAECIYEFLESIAETVESSPDFWAFFRELLLFEDGYIRYDFDPANANGSKHPPNHFDIFYTNEVTFKIGLKKKISEKTLMDLLDLRTDCHYLNIPRV